jgi:large subunit ribosomal protein L15
MRITDLKPNPSRARKPKRVGRGISAGQGKSCGRGQKGQKYRSKIPPGFEGGQTPKFRRLPSLRGQSNRAHNIGIFRHEYAVVNLEDLNRFEAGAVVDPQALLDSGLVRQVKDGIKVLGRGEVDRALTIQAHAFSRSAREAIENAGGTAEVIGS